MLLQNIKQSDVRNVNSNGTGTMEIAARGTHYVTYLKFLKADGSKLTQTEIKAQVGDIIVKINAEQILEADVSFLLARAKYYGEFKGAGAVDGVVPIFWTLPLLPSQEERAITALGMEGVRSFNVDVKFKTLTTLDTVKVDSLVSGEVRKVGRHIRIQRMSEEHATASRQEISSLPVYDGDPSVAYRAIHIEKNVGVLKYVNVKRNLSPIIEELDEDTNKIQLQDSKRTPQSGFFHIDFTIGNSFSSVLPLANMKDFRQELEWSTAPTDFKLYLETIHGLQG